jgi:hypothetical protein
VRFQTGSVQEVVSKERRCNRLATGVKVWISQGQRRQDLREGWGITVGSSLTEKVILGNRIVQTMQLFAYTVDNGRGTPADAQLDFRSLAPKIGNRLVEGYHYGGPLEVSRALYYDPAFVFFLIRFVD